MMSTSEASGDEYFLHKVGERSSASIEVDVTANGRKLTMEVDTGVALSIISQATKELLFSDLPLLITMHMHIRCMVGLCSTVIQLKEKFGKNYKNGYSEIIIITISSKYLFLTV